MSDDRPLCDRLKWVLIVAGAVILLAAGAIAISIATRPIPILLQVIEPAGVEVYCDIVVDGHPESLRETVPFDRSFLAEQFRCAVIPTAAEAGTLRVELSGSSSHASARGAGLIGECTVQKWSTRISLEQMTTDHINNMRAARRLTEGDEAPLENRQK